MSSKSAYDDAVTGVWRDRETRFHRSRVIVKLATDRPPGSSIRPDPKYEKEYRRRFEEVRRKLSGAELYRRIGSWAVLRLPPDGDVIEATRLLEGDRSIHFVEPDFAIQALTPPIPVEPQDDFMSPPGVTDPPYWQWGMSVIGMPYAWALQQGNDSVFVMIVDSGILAHVDLDLARFWWGGNFRDDPADPPGTVVVTDPDGGFTSPPDAAALAISGPHGMAVAGAVAAREELAAPADPDQSGVAGMNWGSPVGICRVTSPAGGGFQGDVLPAVLQALLRTDTSDQNLVVNLSLAYISDPPLPEISPPVGTFDFMIQEAAAAGAILVCAAGNVGEDQPRLPAAYAAGCPDTVLAVGQTELPDGLAAGDRPYVFAHGNVSLVAPGHDLPVLSNTVDAWERWLNSSSLAAPHVTGLASLMWSHNPALTAGQIIDKLKLTAHIPPGTIDPDGRWGHGSIRALPAILAVEDRAVVSVVVDRSGSMALPSGTPGLSRMDVLRGAVDVLVNVMESHSHVGVISFNHLTTNDLGPTEIHPEAPDLSRATVTDAIGPIVPGGTTSIGGGVQAGADQVATVEDAVVTGIPKRAIVLVTDGRENEPPWVLPRDGADALDLTQIGVPVYSIGAGTSDAVDVAALAELSAATGGEHVVTGAWDEESEQLLAKFLIQHLTTIVGDVTILDPSGVVRPGDGGVEIEIPVTGLERRLDVVLVVPENAPVGLALVTPAGHVIDAAIGSVPPRVEVHESSRVRLCRVHLPFRAKGAREHAGTWKAVLDTEAQEVPYTLAAGARSRLRLGTELDQTGTVPGDSARVVASLETIRIGRAKIEDVTLDATITRPDGTGEVRKVPGTDGRFDLRLDLPASGVYHARLTVRGRVDGHAFTREKTVTALVHEPDALVDEDHLDRGRRAVL